MVGSIEGRPPSAFGVRRSIVVVRSLLGLSFLVLFVLCQGLPLHTAAARHPLTTLLCLAAALCVAGSPAQRKLDALTRALLAWPRAKFLTLLFCVSLLINLAMAFFVFDAIPRLDDGAAALFQARIFARWKVTLPLPPHAEFFELFGILGDRAERGHWCGMYPPGWPALLTPGVWLGIPWAVNPLLGALLTVAITALGTEMFDSRTGRIAGLLGLLSPFVVALAGLHLSHMPTGLFMTLCLLALLRLLRTNRWPYGLAAGLACGMALLCRPLTAAVMGGSFGLVLLFRGRAVWRNMPGLVAAAAGVAAAAAISLLFQQAITGDMFTAGHEIGMGARGRFGFVRLDAVRTHTLALGAVHTLWRLRALNDNLLGWAIPSLLLAAAPFFMRRRGIRYLLPILPLPALLAAYAPYWYYESCLPARYVFSAAPLLLILCARALLLIRVRCRNPPALARRVFSGAVCFNLLFFLSAGVPAFLSRFDARYWDVEGVLRKVIEAYDITHAVVFMDGRGEAEPREKARNDYYATGFLRNDLDLRGDVVFARNLRGDNHRLVGRYPGRDYYLYRYLRGLDKACLYRIRKTASDLEYVALEPRGPHMVSVPEVYMPAGAGTGSANR